MSAFLGQIHYWLFNKIKQVLHREKLLHNLASETCGSAAEELQQQVWQSYGTPLPDKDLTELIDQSNIHGWLQKQINIAETREAAYIHEIIGSCGETAKTVVKKVFEEHGKTCGHMAKEQGKYDSSKADQIYNAINDFYLNGMPCDQADKMIHSSPQKVVWQGSVCLQEPNWKRAGADIQLMNELYAIWLSSFCKAMNPKSSYSRMNENISGNTQYRHEIVIAA